MMVSSSIVLLILVLPLITILRLGTSDAVLRLRSLNSTNIILILSVLLIWVPTDLDAVSAFFIVLTNFMFFIGIRTLDIVPTNNYRVNVAIVNLMQFILNLLFMVSSIIELFISFEFILLPLFIYVGTYGMTENRERAAYLLKIYTLLLTFAWLFSISKMVAISNTTDMSNLIEVFSGLINDKWLYLGIFLAIAVKAPLVPFHNWLFRAHAEANLLGSILLAGIILKLATYLYIRLLIPLFPNANEYFKPIVLTICFFSLFHGSLGTFVQFDTKAFVAYSSVAHMSIVILGLASVTLDGYYGSMLLSLAHGLISPALFIVVGGVIYNRYHTRNMRYLSGLGSYMPLFKVVFFLLVISNMATPGSSNWIAELLCLIGTFNVSPVAAVLCSSSVLLSSIYSIWLFNRVSGGTVSPYLALTNDLLKREAFLIMILVILGTLFGIYPNLIISYLYA